jgi:hypothetical protein
MTSHSRVRNQLKVGTVAVAALLLSRTTVARATPPVVATPPATTASAELVVKTQCYSWGGAHASKHGNIVELKTGNDNLVVHAIVPMAFVSPPEKDESEADKAFRNLWKVTCDKKTCVGILVMLRNWDHGRPLDPADVWTWTGRVLSRTASRWIVTFGEMNVSRLTIDLDAGSLSVAFSGHGVTGTGVTSCPDIVKK